METRYFIGIDPGLTGAVAIIDPDGVAIWLEDIPLMAASMLGTRKVKTHINPLGLYGMLRSAMPQDRHSTAIIERTSAMPGQGSASMYSMGDTFGVCRSVCAILRIRVEYANPATWKRAMGLGKDKEASRAKAIEMFPMVAGRLTRKKDHNRSEALLLAEYGRKFEPRIKNNGGRQAPRRNMC